jgi:hypothetical protein
MLYPTTQRERERERERIKRGRGVMRDTTMMGVRVKKAIFEALKVPSSARYSSGRGEACVRD